jgi:hypothetical protein
MFKRGGWYYALFKRGGVVLLFLRAVRTRLLFLRWRRWGSAYSPRQIRWGRILPELVRHRHAPRKHHQLQHSTVHAQQNCIFDVALA